VTRIYKQAGRELIVFRDVSLAWRREIVALVGPSGAGKLFLHRRALESPSWARSNRREAATNYPWRRTEICRRALASSINSIICCRNSRRRRMRMPHASRRDRESG
jgi:ABC-type glutathione transport system ATPase component